NFEPVEGGGDPLLTEATQCLGNGESTADVIFGAEAPLADRDAAPGVVLGDPVLETRNEVHTFADPRLVAVRRVPQGPRGAQAQRRGLGVRVVSVYALGLRVEMHVEHVENSNAGILFVFGERAQVPRQERDAAVRPAIGLQVRTNSDILRGEEVA